MGEFFKWVLDLIIKNGELRLATQKDKSEILELLKLAIRCTNRHIEETRNKDTNKDSHSDELMEKWNNVASKVRIYDADLARIFDSKSDYWYNPEKFKNEIASGVRTFDFRFRLAEVEKIAEELKKVWFG